MTILDRITRKSKNIAAFSKREIICAQMRERLENENFSIISSNCIGGILCHDLNVRYNSPTVNMFFVAADFVKFCSRIPYYTTSMIIQWRKLIPCGFFWQRCFTPFWKRLLYGAGTVRCCAEGTVWGLYEVPGGGRTRTQKTCGAGGSETFVWIS